MQALVIAIGLLIADTAIESGACPSVREVKLLPFYSEYGRDEAYDRLRTVDACDAVLRNTLMSLEPSKDVRESPFGPVNYVLGDTAFFILAEKYDIQLEDTLSATARAEWEAMGVFAYFGYVSEPVNRAKAAKKLMRLVDAKKAAAKG